MLLWLPINYCIPWACDMVHINKLNLDILKVERCLISIGCMYTYITYVCNLFSSRVICVVYVVHTK